MQHNKKQSDGEVNDITLRDYFAAKALSGLLANAHLAKHDMSFNAKDLPTWAYQFADSMMQARKVKNG